MLKKYYNTCKNSKTSRTLTVVVLLYVVLLNQIIVINLVKLHSKMFALKLWLSHLAIKTKMSPGHRTTREKILMSYLHYKFHNLIKLSSMFNRNGMYP